ncbi:hypothetical protein [Streptomyces avermitilis]|uniref:hypothetical protein n=1 Tax=Streptomyces avermitilis TaxID=33903 RepID=UPI003802C7D7
MTVSGVLTFAGALFMMVTLDARLLGVTLLVLTLVGVVITVILPGRVASNSDPAPLPRRRV